MDKTTDRNYKFDHINIDPLLNCRNKNIKRQQKLC